MKRIVSRLGLFLVITDDTVLASALPSIQPRGMQVKVWRPEEDSPLSQQFQDLCKDGDKKATLVKGNLRDPEFYTQWSDYNPISVVLAVKSRLRHERIRRMVLRHMRHAKLLSLMLSNPSKTKRTLVTNDRELILPWAELLIRPLNAELRHSISTHLVNSIRTLLEDADKVALLLQPDPDPDGLASALALRQILGRNKISSPIVSFGAVKRPENLAMMSLLDIEVQTIKPEQLKDFERIVLLDTQPAHFEEKLPRIDAIIDHHPTTGDYSDIAFVDIRPQYGATSTMLTEYIRASATQIGQRLATAMLYGIKADTLLLNREVIEADLDAFVSLYPLINYNLLRRIEKPQLPLKTAPALARALHRMRVQAGVLVSCLGEVEEEFLIPQIADFLMQFEDVEWVICVGIFENDVVMSIRNVGYVKNAGDVVKKVVADFGMGGGHRTMAKAIIPVENWKKRYLSTDVDIIVERTLELFVQETT